MVHGFPLSSVLPPENRRTESEVGGGVVNGELTREKMLGLSREAASGLLRAPLQPNTVYFDTMNSLGGVYLRRGRVLSSVMCLRFAVECMYALCELYTGRRFRHLGVPTGSTDDSGSSSAKEGVEFLAGEKALANMTLHKILCADTPAVPSRGTPLSSSSAYSACVSAMSSRQSTPPTRCSDGSTAPTSPPASSPPVFAYFFTVLCEALQTERAAAHREALARKKEEDELEKMKRRRQTEYAAAAFSGAREGVPAASETALEEHRLPPRKLAHRQPKSLAEDMLPYGTIVFYNLGEAPRTRA